ncbi:MAG: protease modulator HflK, partial [Rhodocyclales bacterium CG17_big_fil_post_rev_8_21_14_2_50_68_7]
GGPPKMPLSPRQFGGGIGILVMLVVVVWLASGFYIVDASQRGVVLQFG